MREAYGVDVAPRTASVHGIYADALERQRRTAARRLHEGQLSLETAA
jgi:hypothetical protein